MTTLAERVPTTKTADSQLSAERKARRFYWTFLILATTASVGGNVAHALLNPDQRSPALIAAAVFLAPPAILLGVTHGAGLRARAPRAASEFNYWATRVIAVLLGAGAAPLSFDSLRDLALGCGVRPSMTWIWALIIDLAIAYATLELFSLTRRVDPDEDPLTCAVPAAGSMPEGATPALAPPAAAHNDAPEQPAASAEASLPDDPAEDLVNITKCDGCGAAEVADETHPARTADARRRRGWHTDDRHDLCPTCAADPKTVTVTKLARPVAAVPSPTRGSEERTA